MPEYSRRPIAVDAIRFTGTNLAECSTFIVGAEIDHDDLYSPPRWMTINTPDHYTAIDSGHWIVRYPDGRFDIFDDGGFRETFEPIGGDSHA